MTTLRLEISTPSGGAFQILLDPSDVDLGRSARCGVRLPYPSVSSRHLRLSPLADGWSVTDLGSKNGTMLDGRTLPPHTPVTLHDDAVIQIADVRIRAALTGESTEGFTLTESGTMLRKLVAESTTDTNAYLETLAGERIEVPDFASSLQPDGAPFLIDRRGHGFWVTPLRALGLNGSALTDEGAPLMDGEKIEFEDEAWTFHDPLQNLVDELDDDIDEPIPSHERREPNRSRDHVFLVVGIVAVISSLVALLVVFEIV